jgi:hypothetical protein
VSSASRVPKLAHYRMCSLRRTGASSANYPKICVSTSVGMNLMNTIRTLLCGGSQDALADDDEDQEMMDREGRGGRCMEDAALI